MSAHASDWCHTFCTPDEDRPGTYEIQWQFPQFTITCRSTNLGFAQAIQDFVSETRNNPKYRDTPLGDGVYHCMDEKSIDLSQYFHAVQLRFQKSGESDHRYVLRYECADGLAIVVDLDDKVVDEFMDGINDIVGFIGRR